MAHRYRWKEPTANQGKRGPLPDATTPHPTWEKAATCVGKKNPPGILFPEQATAQSTATTTTYETHTSDGTTTSMVGRAQATNPQRHAYPKQLTCRHGRIHALPEWPKPTSPWSNRPREMQTRVTQTQDPEAPSSTRRRQPTTAAKKAKLTRSKACQSWKQH